MQVPGDWRWRPACHKAVDIWAIDAEVTNVNGMVG